MSLSKSRGNLISYGTFVRAVAGAVGSMTAMSVFYPLDTVRLRLQVEDSRISKNTLAVLKDLVVEEGFSTLYRGLGPVIASLCCSNFVYFYTFHGLRSIYLIGPENRAMKDLFLGMVAGIVNVLSTTPCWVVNTRIKMQGTKGHHGGGDTLKKYPHYSGIIDGLIKIAKTEGIAQLWSGTIPSLMLVLNPAIQFMVYEDLKRRSAISLNNAPPSAVTVFMIGAMAKCVATVFTYPLQIIQSKLRYGTDEFKSKNVFQILKHIIRVYGVKGLFKGMESKLLQTVLTAALMFLCYEKIVNFVFVLMNASSARSS